MTKLSDLKVKDKFRFVNEDDQFDVTDIRTRSDGEQEVNLWSDKTGFSSFFIHCEDEVELITEPQYRPYSDLRPLVGKALQTKDGNACKLAMQATVSTVWLSPSVSISAAYLLENFVHLDGTPCGELVE